MFKRSSPLENIQAQLSSLSSSLKTVSENINKTRNAFLKWSYDPEETNLCLTHVFSCCVDLDYAHEELTKQLQAKNAEYRQSFKHIIDKEADLEKIKAKTAAEVKRLNQKIDRLTNEKKKPKAKKINVHEEMSKIVQQIQDAANKLKEKEDSFENFKAKSLRDAVISYSSECSAIQSKINLIFQTRAEVSKLMSSTPTLEKEGLPDGNILVQKVFKKVDMELPDRKAQFDRQQSEKASTTNRDVLTRLSIYHDIGADDEDGDDDYPVPPSQTDPPLPSRESSIKKNKHDSPRLNSKADVRDIDDKGYLLLEKRPTRVGSEKRSQDTEDDYLVAKPDSVVKTPARTENMHRNLLSSIDNCSDSSDDQQAEYENEDFYQELDEAREEEYSYPTVMIGQMAPGFNRHDSTSSNHEDAVEDEYYCDADDLTANTKAESLAKQPQYINNRDLHQQKKIHHTLSAPPIPKIQAVTKSGTTPSSPEIRPRNESLPKPQPRAPVPLRPHNSRQNLIDELKLRNK